MVVPDSLSSSFASNDGFQEVLDSRTLGADSKDLGCGFDGFGCGFDGFG